MKYSLFLILLISYEVAAENLVIPDIKTSQKIIEERLSIQKISCAQCDQEVDSIKKLTQTFLKLGGNQIALTQALCFFNKYKNTKFYAKDDQNKKSGIQIKNSRFITINDLDKPSTMPRLYLLDLKTGEVQVTFSAHGGGQKNLGERIKSKNIAQEFSNKSNSKLSARGFFITGSRYVSGSAQWHFAMKLHGIESEINDNTFNRAIVMHPYPGMEEKMYSTDDSILSLEKLVAQEVMPLSWGCTMLSPKYASVIIDKIKASSPSEGGSLYYNFTVAEKNYGESYCGSENLLIKK